MKGVTIGSEEAEASNVKLLETNGLCGRKRTRFPPYLVSRSPLLRRLLGMSSSALECDLLGSLEVVVVVFGG